MLSYDNAVKTILDNVKRLEVVKKPLLACMGHVAAENIYADLDLPQLPISGPDGYAVRSLDIKRASPHNPVILRIFATARAGRVLKRTINPDTAIRIMTGAVLPNGADCVVRFEDTDEPEDKNGPNKNNPSQVRIYVSANPGDNVRPAGSNVRKGALIIPEGTLIGPAQISALAAIGRKWIRVIRRPVVAIIATGDELISLGNPLAPGKTYNCNTAAIASLTAHYGGIPKILGIARDKEADLVSKIHRGMKADVIITSGGVSKGDYDLVRLVLGKLGKLVFSRIKMGPGAAVAFGKINRPSADDKDPAIPVLSLAGPPAGCLINFETLVRPALLKIRGLTTVAHPLVEAIAQDSIPQKMGIAFVRYSHLQEAGGRYLVTLNIAEKMGMLASIAAANSLTIIPEGSVVKAGDKIQVLPLDWRGHDKSVNHAIPLSEI
jgi:molybdopterin molybdotransferase